MSPIGVCSSMRNMLPLICAWTPRPSKGRDRKSTRLNSSHLVISYAVFCLKKKKDHRPNMHVPNAVARNHPLVDTPVRRPEQVPPVAECVRRQVPSNLYLIDQQRELLHNPV